MDSISILYDNSSQNLSIDYIPGTVGGPLHTSHLSIIPGLHTFQPHIKIRAERGQATCARIPATKYQGYSSNLNPGLAPKLPVLLWPTPLFQ